MESISLEMVQTLVTLVAVLALGLVALGTVGLTGLYVVLRQNGRILEHLYLIASPDVQHWIREFVLAVKDGTDLAADLTDGDPRTPRGADTQPDAAAIQSQR